MYISIYLVIYSKVEKNLFFNFVLDSNSIINIENIIEVKIVRFNIF